MTREESFQKTRKSDNDNSKLQVIINLIDENKGTNKNKPDLLNKMNDNNMLFSKNLLQDRKIFNYIGMILKKFICEQLICGKLYTTKSNKNMTILQSLKRPIKNVKIAISKEEIFVRIEKGLKK